MTHYEPAYPHRFRPAYISVPRSGYFPWSDWGFKTMDFAQRRYWRERKAIQPLLDRVAIAAYLAARVPPGAYVRSMLRVLAMTDAPATLLVLWFDDGCNEDFPCY